MKIPLQSSLLDRPACEACFDRAKTVIPGGVNSPIRAFKDLGIPPLVARGGKRDLLIDADGHTYLDYCGSWGALIHGHAHPRIIEAACKQMELGSTFGLLTEAEEKLATKVLSHVPEADKIRFVSTGTEAVMTAIRLARGYTQKNKIIKFSGHYHGHIDALLVKAGSGCLTLGPSATSKGIPQAVIQDTLCIPFNDEQALEEALSRPDVAAVIVEPIAANMGLVFPHPGFLQQLRRQTQANGVLLIADEVITGFRFRLGSVCKEFGIIPDLITFGKIIGGGFPAAAVAGKKEIMDLLAPLGPVYQAGTLSGNPVAMVAGYEAITLLEEPGFYNHLEKLTQALIDPIAQAIYDRDLPALLHHKGSVFTLFLGQKQISGLQEVQACDGKAYQAFFRFLFERGIYVSPLQCEANFVSASHSPEHITYTAEVILEFFDHFYS
jgi:glutamate-1-semialdehyde 2,1-aminomutase